MKIIKILRNIGAAFLALFFAWSFIVMCSGCAGWTVNGIPAERFNHITAPE
jgi:hypothetical protein